MKTLIPPIPTIEWNNGHVRLIDQTKLPLEEKYIKTDDYPVGWNHKNYSSAIWKWNNIKDYFA